MKLIKYSNFTLITIILFLFSNSLIFAYDDDIAHPKITDKAVRNSHISNYLSQNFEGQFARGIQTMIYDRSILDWIKAGSIEEDSPNCRASNHFHNPLVSWDQSFMSDDTGPALYIRDYCNFEGWTYENRKSNITWATGYLAPAPYGKKEIFTAEPDYTPYNWDKARDSFYKALTANSQDSNESYFAETFKTLGHLLHLLQDTSVPAHTRNDLQSHLILDLAYGTIQPFENYIKIFPSFIHIADPTNNYPTFSNESVTNFWDTDQYDGSNPSIDTTIGLSEFSNANFFSDTTIMKEPLNDPLHSFPYPAWSNIEEYEEIDITTGKVKTYVKQIGIGESVNHLAATKWYYKHLPSPYKHLGLMLDMKCHEDYARTLLPRTIGYSSELLNYFFRGEMEGWGMWDAPPDNESVGIYFSVRNLTANEAMGPGKFVIAYKYNEAGEDIFGLTDEVQLTDIILPDSPWRDFYIEIYENIPPTAIDIHLPPPNDLETEYWLVYRGKLGNEEDAVVGKKIHIEEYFLLQ